jgi:hypothetical protein
VSEPQIPANPVAQNCPISLTAQPLQDISRSTREAADRKAKAIVNDLRASKMGNAADLVEQLSTRP